LEITEEEEEDGAGRMAKALLPVYPSGIS